MSDNWLDRLSEILSQPLPGTSEKAPSQTEPPPVILPENEDDDSLLDRITDILSRPLPGTEAAPPEKGPVPEPENPGEVAVQEASKENDDPVSSTAAAGANWMQMEYQRFMAYQEQTRKAFADRQKLEMERFAAYQRAQLDRLLRTQERERMVFQQHQQARAGEWQAQIRHQFPPGPPPGFPPGGPPGRMPPPPPPWWRGRRR
jgi:hypothetical protein